MTATRFIIYFLVAFVADMMPRKWMLAMSGALAGVVLLLTGILHVTIHFTMVFVLVVFCFLHQIGFALGIDPLQHIYG